MAYTPINWEDSPSTKTPVNAENLNKMDNGIFDAHKQLGALPEWSKNEEKPKYTAEDVGTYTKEEIDIYKANSILSKTSGTTIHTTDSAKVKPNIKTFGKSSQKTYEEANLFDVSKVTSVNMSDYEVVNNNDGSITVVFNGGNFAGVDTLQELAPNLVVGETYILNATVSTNTVSDIWLDGANIRWEFGTQLTITEDILTSTVKWFGDGFTTRITFSDIRISSVGSEQSSFSLDSPQEITPIGESGSIMEKVLTRQLLNVNDAKTNLYGTIDDEGYVTFEYDNTQGTTSMYPRLIINTSELLQPNTSYMLVTEIVEVSNIFMLALCSNQNISQFNETIQVGSSNIKTGTRVDTVSTLDDFGECECAIRCGVTISAGASGKIKLRLSIIEDTTVTADTFVYEPYSEQSITLQTPNGLHGIPLGQTIPDAIKNSPIHMSGVYWDEVEQRYYIGDTKNEDGKDVQRIWNGNPLKTIVFMEQDEQGRCKVFDRAIFNTVFVNGAVPALSTFALWSSWATGNNLTFALTSDGIYYKDTTKTLEEVNALFAELGTNFEVCGVLAKPIITDTREEELAQYNAVHMNYPNTTIVNDAGAHMEVEYVADTKEHIKQNYIPRDEFEELKDQVAEIQAQLVNA